MSTISKSYEDSVEIINEKNDIKEQFSIDHQNDGKKYQISPRYKGKNPKSPEELAKIREAKKVKADQKNDMVNHPSHYMLGKYEVIDIIEEATKDLTGIFATDTGNALKYIMRWNKKQNPKEDLRKAVWYLNHLIKKLDEAEFQLKG